MSTVVYFCAFSLFYLQASLTKRQLPEFLKVCHRHDPHLGECIKSSIETLKPHLGKGVPEMRIVPFDPLHVTRMELNNGNVNFIYDNMDFYKMDQFDLTQFHMDYENCTSSMDIYHPLVPVEGLYSVKGRLLIFELEGEGKISFNFTDVRMSVKMNCTRQIIKNKEYAKFNSIDLQVKLGDYHVALTDLFKNNPELTERTNAVFNENSKILISEFEPLVATGVKEIVLSTVQAVFDRFPLEELLPE